MVRTGFRERGGGDGKPASIAGRLGLSLFFFVFFAMGSLFEVLIFRELARAVGQRSWRKVPCAIIHSEVQERSDRERPYIFAVRYRYEYGGQPHTGSTYKRNYSGSDKYSGTQQLVQKYPTGRSAFCYVNPADPSQVVLRRDNLAIGLVLLFPPIFMVVGAGGIYFIWRKTPPERDKPIAATAASAGGGKGLGRIGLAALCGVVALVGAVMFYFLSVRWVAKTIDARSWIETPCRVLRAEVRDHDSDDGTTYSVYILYEYEFSGRTYKNDRYDFVGGSSSGYKGKARIVAQYRSAANPVCYVNPRDPTEAVLKRGFHAKLLLALFPLPFLAVGIGGLVASLRHKKGPDPATGLPRADRSPTMAGSAASLLRLPDTGPVVLRSQHSPSVRLVGAVIFAGFWNGIVSIFVFQVVDGFRHGSPSWLLMFFLVPFVLIGLGLLGMVLYQFLAMFNPRPRLTLSSDRIPLGGAAEVCWSFSGQARRIREFTLMLHGVEEARYRKGTNTCTDRNTFCELELCRTSDMAEIASGQIGFVLPQDTMHSFEAENNKILWTLDLHGDIKGWPDVKESFKINVAPIMA
jgi:hypothetical protein